jgi:hypothetical protein
MIQRGIWQLLKSDYLRLLPVIALAFYVVFIPHQSYPYPVHVDEWVHMANAKAIVHQGSTTFIDPFSGEATINLSSNLEAGFHVFWGVFQQMSGLSWIIIFRYFPGIIFIVTVLSVYMLAQREGFGLEAAFFTCLIPTTVGILGPAFLVPVSMGLVFTPVILFLAFNYRTLRSYILTFIIICFLLAIHAPSAICPIIVLAPYILLNCRDNIKHSLGLGLALVLPFLLIFPWIINLLLPTARSLFVQSSPTEFVQLPRIITNYGYLPILFCMLGVFLLSFRGGRQNYGLVLGLLALLIMLATFFTLHYGVPIMYERGLMYMMLMAGVVAGAGLAGVRTLKLPDRFNTWLKVPFVTQNVGRFLYLALIITILVVVLPIRLGTPYYHMIDEKDYQAFNWIKYNIGAEKGKAILDPWKATAFTAISGKQIYTRIHAYPTDKDDEAYTFLENGSANTAFLRENGISIIYTRVSYGGWTVDYDSDNPDLLKVAENIYLLKELAD